MVSIKKFYIFDDDVLLSSGEFMIYNSTFIDNNQKIISDFNVLSSLVRYRNGFLPRNDCVLFSILKNGNRLHFNSDGKQIEIKHDIVNLEILQSLKKRVNRIYYKSDWNEIPYFTFVNNFLKHVSTEVQLIDFRTDYHPCRFVLKDTNGTITHLKYSRASFNHLLTKIKEYNSSHQNNWIPHFTAPFILVEQKMFTAEYI